MPREFKRHILYKDRLNAAWEGLTKDVERWRDTLPEDTAIKHHLGQFRVFCEEAHRCLMEAYPNGGWGRLTFRSLVIGVLTSQWMLLRQVASQRLPGHPYQEGLEKFDRQAADNYRRLSQVLPQEVGKHLSLSPPLLYLGRLAELTLFGPNAPAVLSVPFGVLYEGEGRSARAIPHEVSHAVFKQLSSFLPELKRQVLNFLAGTQPNRQQEVLHEMIMGWLDDIVADLVGTALDGPAFAQSALWITVSSDATVGITDEEHPVPLLRPYVHLEALKHLTKKEPGYGQAHAAGIESFKDEFSKVVGTRLSRRFESVPALTVISLKTVKDEMVKVIEPVLDSKLDALGGMSLGEVLVACAASKPGDTDVALPGWGEIADEKQEWGKISEEECQQLVLDLPDSLRPEHATPTASSLAICCRKGWWICC